MNKQCIITNSAINQLYKALKVKLPKTKTELLDIIKETYKGYSSYSNDEILNFSETLINGIDKILNIWKLKGFKNTDTLRDLFSDINYEEIANNIAGGGIISSPQPETGEEPSKAIGDSLKQFNTLDKFDERFGTSIVRAKLQETIHQKVKNMFFIDSNGFELLTKKDINRAIRNYLNEVYSKAVQYAKKYDKTIKDNLFDGNANYNVNKLIQLLNQYIQVNPELLTSLYASNSSSDKEMLDFINNVSILQFFDLLLVKDLGKNLTISAGLDGIFTEQDKYELKYENANMTKTFRDDDKDINGHDESNDHVKRLKTLQKYDSKGNIVEGQLISSELFSYVNTRIKLFIHSIDAFKDLKIDGVTLYDLVVDSYIDNMQGFQKLYETLYRMITGDLVIVGKELKSVNDLKQGESAVKVSFQNSKNSSISITDQDLSVIVSAYKEIFDSDLDSKSLYASYINTCAYLFSKGVDINIQPMNYYGMVVQNLATQEAISQQSYTEEDNAVESKTLHAKLQQGKTYYIDQMLDGKFSVQTDSIFKTFEFSDFDSEGTLYIYIEANDDTIYRITKKGTDSAATFKLEEMYGTKGNYKVKNEIKQQDINDKKFNQHMLNFSNFFKEILNIDLGEPLYLKTLQSLYSSANYDLFKMVSNTLYAYAVSKKLYNDKNIQTLKQYKEALSSYYGDQETPKISKSAKQLKYTNVKDTNLKIQLAVTKEILHNVLSGNILKDSQGKAISLIGLSQLATRIEQQIKRIKEKSTTLIDNGNGVKVENSETVEDSVSKFTASRIYQGVEFAREYSGKGESKKATQFSVQEHFYSSFVLDYLNNVGKGKLVKFMPSIISDKSKLMKINMDLDQKIKNSEGKEVAIHQLSIEDIHKYTKEELGLYYKRLYEQAKKVFQTLSNGSGFTFDYDSNFTTFNTEANAVIEQSSTRIKQLKQQLAQATSDKQIDKIKKAIVSELIKEKKNIIHNILLKNKGVELVDVLHYSFDRKTGNLIGNTLLIDQLYRWEVSVPKGLFKAYGIGTSDYTGYGKSDQFFYTKELDLVSSLIYENGEIRLRDEQGRLLKTVGLERLGARKGFLDGENIAFALIKYSYTDKNGKEKQETLKLSDKDSIVNSYIYKQIRKNKNFSQYAHLGESYNPFKPEFSVASLMEAIQIYLTSEKVLTTLLKGVDKENISEVIKTKFEEAFAKADLDTSVTIEIHPDLKKYQALDYWLTQEYMNMSVGTHLNHPASGKTLIEQESKAWANQVKRNVSMTAAKHVFAQNVLTGIRPKYKACVIEDDSDSVSTIHGVEAKQKYTDGATYNSGVTNYLENFSLQGDKAGVNKKQFVHFWKNGYGGIIKTAGFPITNEGLRKSKYLQRINRITLTGDVLNQDGTLNTNIDITKGFNGSINYGDVYYQKYDSEGTRHIYRIKEIKYSQEGTVVTEQELLKGQWVDIPSKNPVKLKTLHDIWNLFGGYNSLELIPGKSNTNSENFILSENSFKQLTLAVNYVGTLKDGVKGPAVFQKQVHQPLKEALIDYVITGGAIKQGAANVNTTDAYFDDNYKVTTIEIDTHDAGIQLNAEHHADGSTLSLMTQVINALTARGYSVKEGSEVYTALKILVMDALKDYDSKDELGELIKRNDFVANLILRSLTTDEIESEQDLMHSLLKNINQMYRSGNYESEDILKAFPIDHPSLLDNAVSKISSFLSKSTVKIKFPGSMQVLVPSNKIYRLYKDKLLSAYPNQDDIETLDFGIDIAKSLSNVELGKHYRVTYQDGTVIKDVFINTPSDYYNLYRSNPIIVEENYSAGRELAAYNLTFTGNDGRLYNLWDISPIFDMWNTNESILNPDDRIRKLQETMARVKNGETIPVKVFNQETQKFEEKLVIIKNLNIKPYELICGNVYQTTFGLKVGDDVSDIVNDKKFFLRRLIQNYRNHLLRSEHWDVELKKVSGDHLYLKHLSNGVPKGLVELNVEKRYSGNDVVQIDSHGKIVRKLSSMNDKIYVDREGNQIIATENFDFYLNSHNFVQICLSNSIASNTLLKLENSKNEQMIQLLNELNQNGNVQDAIKELNKKSKQMLNTLLAKGKAETKYLQTILNNAYATHTSFIKSLDMIASRTPAQCHQSFMAMKVVGFDQSGLNNAYVNRMQLYLQGSDYDIDKVSLLGYVIKHGKFVKWSPYMKLDSIDLLRASEYLPFPTGNAATTVEYSQDEELELLNIINISAKINLFTLNESKKLSYRLRNTSQIYQLSVLIKFINKHGLPKLNPQTLQTYLASQYSGEQLSTYSDLFNQIINSLQSIVDKHNLYLDKTNSNKKDAAINFASTKVYQTSKNPANLVQGQISVDEITDVIKDEAVDKPMSQRSKKFAPGNVMSKQEQLVLTLGGKENTSIVASALKVFEAISQSYYKELDDFDGNGNLDYLDVKPGGIDILGDYVIYVANAYSKNPKLTEDILSKLEKVNNLVDAYIYFSGLLSLSTDNAKDPTLTKINAGPEMISLYLAGLALGINFKSLVQLMTSDFAWEMTELMRGNIFNGTQGLRDVQQVLNYCTSGPVEAYDKLPYQMQQVIKNIVYKGMKKWNDVPTRTNENGEDVELSLHEIENYHIVKFLTKHATFNLGELLVAKTKDNEKQSEARQRILNKQYNKHVSFVQKLKKQSDVQELDADQQEKLLIQEEAELDEKDFDIKITSNHQEAFVLLKRFLKEIRKHRRFKRSSFKQIAEVNTDETPFRLIVELQKMAEEMAIVRTLVALNQDLPNNVQDILKIIRRFEDILANRITKDSDFYKKYKTKIVDIKRYVDDFQYRMDVINAYEQVKDYINPFRVIENNDHYFSYLKSLQVQYDSFITNSTIIKASNEISRDIIWKKAKTNLDQYLKKIKKFVIMKMNNIWMRRNSPILIPNNEYKLTHIVDVDKLIPINEQQRNPIPLQLGTAKGNATFKHWMDTVVFPELQKTLSIQNKLIRDLFKFENSKTEDGNGVVQYGLDFPIFPKTAQELKDFDLYKNALQKLASYKIGNTTIQDLLFYYNLIVYNGENLTNSLSNLFIDIISNKSSNIVNSHTSFYANFRKESFEIGTQYTEDELLKYIAPITTIEGLSKNKLDYARVYSDTKMQYILVYKDKKAAQEILEKLYSTVNDEDIENAMDSEETLINKQGYVIVSETFNKNYYLHNYTEVDPDIQSFVYNGAIYSESDLKMIAAANGHQVTGDIFVLVQSKSGKVRLDKKLTQSRVEEIFKKKDC